MEKIKRKNLSIEEIRELSQDQMAAKKNKRIDRAERIANNIVRRLENGRFQVTENGKISITIWGFSGEFPPVWTELHEVLSRRGFRDIDYDISFVPCKWPIVFRLE